VFCSAWLGERWTALGVVKQGLDSEFGVAQILSSRVAGSFFVWLRPDCLGLRQQFLEFFRKAREGDHPGEIFRSQFADFAVVIRQWFSVCHVFVPPCHSPCEN
jgi:hypothetical protein